MECALKACIAKNVREYDFPDFELARKSYSHKLQELIKTAGLETALANERRNNPDFFSKWLLVQSWKVESRYQVNVSEAHCRDFYTAVTDGASGVLAWIKMRW